MLNKSKLVDLDEFHTSHRKLIDHFQLYKT